MEELIISRKIQLLVDCENLAERNAHYQRIFEWQNLASKAANLVLCHHFLLDNLKEIPYLNDGFKLKLADVAKDELGVLNTSKINASYRMLSQHFKSKIPTVILSSINHQLFQSFNTDKLAYWRGEKSLRNHKKSMAIPFSSVALKLFRRENSKEFGMRLFDIPFRTYLGKDKTDKRTLLQQVMTDKIRLCGSALSVVKGKLFLHFRVAVAPQKIALKAHLIAEAALATEHPITLKIGNDHYAIGNQEEFLYRRMAIQSARHRSQKASSYNHGGHGRKRKLKNLERFIAQEKNYIKSKLHLYSRRLINLCLSHGAATLLLTNQIAKQELANENEFLLRNWSYYGLIEKIKYKAALVGITVVVE